MDGLKGKEENIVVIGATNASEQHLDQALSSMAQGMPDDLVTIDLTAALSALGEITGETVSEELLETIFDDELS